MVNSRNLYISVLVVIGIVLSCTSRPKPVFDSSKDYKLSSGAITIMTYNVENLFDTEHDQGKSDETYLPLAKKNEQIKAKCRAENRGYYLEECLSKDWNESTLDLKLKRLTDVLAHVKNGEGPDVLILQEVENRGVLEKWRKNYLSRFHYHPALLLEGPDERGIDVGILTRLEAVPPLNLHPLKFIANDKLKQSQISETRGILEANFKLPDGSLLTVLGVHLPSQGNPREMRRQALEQLNKLREGLPKDRMVVVGGDFNITSEEEAQAQFFSDYMQKTWGVSHLMGCKSCKGTHYYGRNESWSFLDVLLVSPNMLDGKSPWVALPESVRVENNSLYQVNRFGGPSRFSEHRKDGVSDHWPLAMEIVKRPIAKIPVMVDEKDKDKVDKDKTVTK
ncbi:MAG: endonuclease/exonuclease/phosphatase family protein [Bdellovibrionaceae bacterium]|nr:endonuclease/exonuclease/phosphatase family protein [Pseudobdellovibrionaceae bacterium]